VDPRPEIIRARLSGVRHILAVAAGKGGVGKSTVAAGLSLGLQADGVGAGLLDLDLYGPTAHLILGAAGRLPIEEKGLVPPRVAGVRLMSAAFYSGEAPLPIRGQEVVDATIEMLAVTRWIDTEWLIIDMPPGMGETTLEILRLLPQTRFLLVTTPSAVALATVRKLHHLLRERGAPVAGLVVNMVQGGAWTASDTGVSGSSPRTSAPSSS
jgi:ATP-binding protein involved in chromosome partitioning